MRWGRHAKREEEAAGAGDENDNLLRVVWDQTTT